MSMTVHSELVEGRILVKSDYDFRDRDRIKQLPGAKYGKGVWSLPLSWAACQQLRGVFGDELEIGDALAAWSWSLWDGLISPCLTIRETLILEDAHPFSTWIKAWRDEDDGLELYPFQEVGVSFLATARRAYLADEMGSGKTIQIARTLRLLHQLGEQPLPAIIVAPAQMIVTWGKELQKWFPEAKVAVLKGTMAKRRKTLAEDWDILVTNFEAVKSHSRLAGYGAIRLKKCYECDPTLDPADKMNAPSRCQVHKKELNETAWRTVVVDEAHRLKDPKAQQTRAVWALRTGETIFRYCLSGTAIANAPHDLWASLHFLDPDAFPNRNKYIGRYCHTSFNVFGGLDIYGLDQSTMAEFFRVLDPSMRRMPKEATLPFLPKKQYVTHVLEMPAKQAKAYKQMQGYIDPATGTKKGGMIAQVANGAVMADSPLTQVTRLSQFAQAFAELDENGDVRLVGPSNKIDALLDLLTDMGDEPLVVFAESRQLIGLAEQALEKAGISFSVIVGGQTPDQREHAKEQFQSGKVRVVMATIAAGGTGITLTRSSTVCFLQRSWSMVNNRQAEDRVHRIGSEIHDKITVIDLVSAGTIELKQRDILVDKGDRLEEIMRDKAFLSALLAAGEED